MSSKKNQASRRKQAVHPTGGKGKGNQAWILLVVAGICGAALLYRAIFPAGMSAKDGAKKVVENKVEPANVPAVETNRAPDLLQPPMNGNEEVVKVVNFMKDGTERMERGDLQGAMESYQEALKDEPDNEDLHFNMGILLAKQGKVDEAISAYQKAIELFPEHVEAMNNLANLLVTKGQMERAEELYKEALDWMPDFAAAHNSYGRFLIQGKRFDEALEQFRLAVEFEPELLEARCNYGNALLSFGEIDQAKEQFDAVLEIQSDFAPAQAGLKRVDTFREMMGSEKMKEYLKRLEEGLQP